MSPLSPLTIEAAKHKSGRNQSPPSHMLIIEEHPNSRFSYNMNQLYNLRHRENIAPSISNQPVFDTIRRPRAQNNNNNRNNMFQFNSQSPSLNRLGGRSNRSIFRPQTLLSGDMDNPQEIVERNQRNGANNYYNQNNFHRGTNKKKKLISVTLERQNHESSYDNLWGYVYHC